MTTMEIFNEMIVLYLRKNIESPRKHRVTTLSYYPEGDRRFHAEIFMGPKGNCFRRGGPFQTILAIRYEDSSGEAIIYSGFPGGLKKYFVNLFTIMGFEIKELQPANK